MAKLTGNLKFTGSFDDFSAYKMRGSDQIILRRKGGPTREAIKTKPNFENTRRNNQEFAGRSFASRIIMQQLRRLKPLADYNIAGPLNALLRRLQVNDPVNDWGKRSMLVSKSPQLLEGFNFNRKYTFDSMVRCPFAYTMDRATGKLQISIPELLPGIHLYTPEKYPLFAFTIVFAVLPDFTCQVEDYHMLGYYNPEAVTVETDWFPSVKGSKPSQLELQLKNPLERDSFSLMLGIGIKFGVMGYDGKVEQVKYAGAAKVMAVRGSV